jgi:molecular chaperone GrpE
MNRGEEDTSSGVIIELYDDEPAGATIPLPPEPPPAPEPRAPSGPSLVRAREESFREGIRATLRQILPELDSLESCYREATDQPSLQQGVRMALRGLWDVFRSHDLERIEGDGIAFDPRFHEAAQVTESTRVPPGTVLEVLRVGYTLAGELVRPAMVRVAVAPGSDKPGDAGQEESR